MDITPFRRTVSKFQENSIYCGDIEIDENGDYLEVPQTVYSNYSGSTIDRANCNWFLKNYGELQGVWEFFGYYGTRGVLIEYKLYIENEEIRELIDGLERYPVFDGDSLVELENEIEEEDWKFWIKNDLIRALEKRNKSYPEDESLLKNKFYEISDAITEYIIFEDAVSCWIDVEKIAEAWE